MNKKGTLVLTASILGVILACSSVVVLLISSGLLKSPDSSALLDTSESRALDNFNYMVVDIAADVTIVQGEENIIEILAEKDDLQSIKTEVTNRNLRIYREDSNLFFSLTTKPQITITLTELESITINGSADVVSDGLNLDELDIKINASGSATVTNITAVRGIEITINGSGEVTMSGDAPDQKVLINASGSFDGKDLKGTNGEVEISGSGEVIINVTDTLDVNIVGSGEVNHVGEPQDVKQQVIGSGSVIQL